MACPVCDSVSVALYQRCNGFDVLRCSACRLLWVPEVAPAVLDAFYSQHYYQSHDVSHGYQSYFDEEPAIREVFRQVEALLPKLGELPERSVLDVGCAYGYFLDEARQRGFRTRGLELSDHCVAHAVGELSLDVRRGSATDLESETDRFGLVSIIGTIEHFADPLDAVAQVNRVTLDGGVLAVTTLDTGGVLNLYHLKPPEHLFYFNRRNLGMLLRKCGFEVVHEETLFRYYYAGDVFERLVARLAPALNRVGRGIGRSRLLRRMVRIPTNEVLLMARKVRSMPGGS